MSKGRRKPRGFVYQPQFRRRKRKEKGMEILEALGIVFKGGMVTRDEWDDEQTRVQMHQKYLCIKMDGRYHSWLMKDEDINATDWKEVHI